MARPTKFNTKTKRRLYKALRIGASRKMAAQYAGISYELLRQWMRRGEQEARGEFVVFLAALKRAESEACMKALEAINGAMETRWQAAAWMLERRYPEDWGRNRIIQHEAKEVVIKYSDPWLVEDEVELEA